MQWFLNLLEVPNPTIFMRAFTELVVEIQNIRYITFRYVTKTTLFVITQHRVQNFAKGGTSTKS